MRTEFLEIWHVRDSITSEKLIEKEYEIDEEHMALGKKLNSMDSEQVAPILKQTLSSSYDVAKKNAIILKEAYNEESIHIIEKLNRMLKNQNQEQQIIFQPLDTFNLA